MSIPLCEECGCEGNKSCGYEPLDEKMACALYEDLVCGCCHIMPRHTRDRIELEKIGQLTLDL
jgi:hypothetical protein